MASLIAFIRADASLDVPLVPASWDVRAEDNRWASLWPLGREAAPDTFFHARLVARASGNPGRAVFVCVGRAGIISRLTDRIAADALQWTATWATLGDLRADGGATATAIKAAWKDERPLVNGTPTGTLVALYARMAGEDAEDGEM